MESYKQWDDNWLGTKVGGLAVLKRVLDILTDEIYLDDIRGAVRWNRVAREVDRLVAGVPAALDVAKRCGLPVPSEVWLVGVEAGDGAASACSRSPTNAPGPAIGS